MDIKKMVEDLAAICREDKEFLQRSRFFDGNARISIGSEGFLLRFSGGYFLGIFPDADPALHWDYEIFGPESDWARLWSGEMDIMQAMVPVYTSIGVRGDRVKFMGDLMTIAHLTRLLPRAAANQGVEPKARPTPPPGGADPWQTKHEVIGRYVKVNGARTYYETIGVKGKATFIGIHTAGREGRQWQQIADAIGDVGEFLAFDFPGHGKSWPMPGGTCLASADEMASFVWAFRNAAGVTGPTVVLGCSIGGNLVFQVAAEHPEEVAALVSFQGADYTPSPPPAALALLDHPRINPAHSQGEQSFALMGKRTPAPQQEYMDWDIRCLKSALIKYDLTAYSRFDFRDRMAGIRCPALLIRGLDDYIVDAAMVKGTASRLTNARAVEIVMPEGVGHFSHMEQPVEHGRLVLDFLKRHGITG
jgi:pimeloyl-ACP methyl ester carboxylesterase